MDSLRIITESPLILISLFLLVTALGFFIGFSIKKILEKKNLSNAKANATKIIEDAKKEREVLIREGTLKAKDVLHEMKNEFEKESREKKRDLVQLEKRLSFKEENLDKKLTFIDSKESEFNKREGALKGKEESLTKKDLEMNEVLKQAKEKLERVAGLTVTDAKKELMDMLINEAKHESAKRIKLVEDEAKETAEKEAKRLISIAIERYSGEYVSERSVSVINLPSDDMKGRIIGREGRNIRTLEAMTGIDFIIDDTPGAIILSGFNPIRREVARLSLEKLMADGRIHPARIEEVVKRTETELEKSIKEAGQKAIFELGITNLHPELQRLVGMLKFRYSYTQNQYYHSIECAHIAGMMAAELKINIKDAKKAALLHDIGKAIDHEVEGTHAMIGYDYAKKYGEPEFIARAIGAHHEEIKKETSLDFIVQAADAISGGRPGARTEILESYLQRIDDLEKIANSFEGVTKSFAIQAGREIRILVEGETMTDDKVTILSRDIARKIESQLTYPGQIKVTVIKETRAVDYAK